MIRVIMPGTVGETAKGQARITTFQEFINQCCSFEQAAVIYRLLVELLKDGYSMIILSMICDNMCKSILNTLQLVLIET